MDELSRRMDIEQRANKAFEALMKIVNREHSMENYAVLARYIGWSEAELAALSPARLAATEEKGDE